MLLPLKQTLPYFSLQKDGEYLCYILLNTVAIASFAIFGFMLLDLLLGIGIVLDPADFDRNKLLFPIALTQLTALPTFILAVLFYLRIRIPIHLKVDPVPVLMHRALLVGFTRRRWITRVLYLGGMGLVAIFLNHIAPVRIALHFEQQDNTLVVLLLSAFFSLTCSSIGAVLLVSYALIAEKVLRHFTEFEKDLLRMNPLSRSY